MRDILSMFEAIQDAQERTADDALKTAYALKFRGFSGNQETSFMAYAEFLKREGGFTHVGDPVKAYSPGPTLPQYRRMLAVWNSVDQQGHLQDQQLGELATAAG